MRDFSRPWPPDQRVESPDTVCLFGRGLSPRCASWRNTRVEADGWGAGVTTPSQPLQTKVVKRIAY